jgi:hypothetical protein
LARFLWVKFQLDDLCRAETDNSIKKVLQNLPRDLSETYDRLLGRIDGAEQREYVKRMFTWIICARRPLEVTELREAIAFTIEDDHFDHNKIPNDLNRLARACGNLIVIDDDEQSVQIAHYTVEQYLLEGRSQPALFSFTKEDANFEVGKVCVAYLSFSDFESQLTEYNKNGTSNMSALEKVVRTQPMLPPNSHAVKLVKALKTLRRSQDSPTNIDFDRHISTYKRRMPIATVEEKYALLSYVAEYWLHHTITFTKAMEATMQSPHHLHLFNNLALHRKFPFDIRPWDGISLRREGFPFVIQIGWAISANHLPLLKSITHLGNEACLGAYMEEATKDFLNFMINSKATWPLLRKYSEGSAETFPHSHDWERWLYHCILRACDQAFTEILEFFFSNWERSRWSPPHGNFFGHLLLDAALHSNTGVVEVVNKITLNWHSDARRELWLNTEIEGESLNALEVAFRSDSVPLMELFALAGCRATRSFKENLLQGNLTKLCEAFEAGDLKKIRCFLRMLGATESSLWHIKYFLSGPLYRPDEDAYALSVAVDAITSDRGSARKSIRPHWAGTVEGVSFQDRIDIILAAGGKPLPRDVSWLLWDAITENKVGRFDLLLSTGVQASDPRYILTAKEGEAIKLKYFNLGGIESISPLCCAILYEREEMVSKFLDAGVSANEVGTNTGLVPIYFAAIADSFESFKILIRYGANLEAMDAEDQNITHFLNYDITKEYELYYYWTSWAAKVKGPVSLWEYHER